MKIKITPQVFLNAAGRIERKYYVKIVDEYQEITKEFDTYTEVQSFLKGLEGK
jgi:hypothetical protein